MEAGDIKIIDGYLKNNSRHNIQQIDFELIDEDIELSNVPKVLSGEDWQLIKIKYAPKKTRLEALNTFITFRGKKRIPP